jgi:hypothetical protein
MSFRVHAKRLAVAAAATAAALSVIAPGAQAADCPTGLQYDPRIPTWDAVFGDGHNAGAHVPFASGPTGSNANNRNVTAVLDEYMDAVMRAADQTGDRVRVVKKNLGPSELGLRGVPVATSCSTSSERPSTSPTSTGRAATRRSGRACATVRSAKPTASPPYTRGPPSAG